ncbi:TetR/AcrR family transcriptional regulator [Streptomyces flavidovirens]|uniref:TetR/AcrR family transcriptional regulator n=1 Tax=Streptomyces flavidovirens TaxID=67298 RepID=UPI0036931DE9
MTEPTPRHRPSARGDGRREEILRAAFELFSERGYRGTSIAAIAERIGLTQQGLMHYFPTKNDLLTAVLELRDQWDVAQVLRTGDSAPTRLDLLADLVEYNTDRPAIVQAFTVLAADSVTEKHPAKPYFQERYGHVRDGVAASLRQEFGEQLPGGLSPEHLAPLVVAAMDGLQLQWLLNPEEVDMSARFRDLLTLLRAATGAQEAVPER